MGLRLVMVCSKEMTLPKTKIVCTIGPASRSAEILEQLVREGMCVARLNFSHGSYLEHGKTMAVLRRLARQAGRSVAILQDLAGPKVRIGRIVQGNINLSSGSTFTLTNQKILGDTRGVSVSYPHLPHEVKPGDTLLLSDGALELEVLETTERDIRCRVVIGGPLSSFKGINLPTRTIQVPSLTQKDRRDLAFGIEHSVDFIALSFVRKAADVLQVKRILDKGKTDIPVIAKIETHEALETIDEIIAVVDGIMVGRGDLGVETPPENVPLLQKQIILKSNQAGKPVITATHMLRSMVDNPRPTRAEVSDVANAVLDGTDAVMLSEETAIGSYPVEAVSMMARIAEQAESGLASETWTQRINSKKHQSLTEAVGHAAWSLAESTDAACIITFTQSGSTARLVAKYRPRRPIIALTPLEKTYRRLALVWGVRPLLCLRMDNTDKMIKDALRRISRMGFVKGGDKVVITAGMPAGVPGKTNLIKVEVA